MLFRCFAVSIACMSLAGCGLFSKKGEETYLSSTPSKSIEVPEGLTPLASNDTLTIASEGGQTAVAEVSDAPPTLDLSSAPENASGPTLTLAVHDEAVSAWRRLGVALQRTSVGQWISSDESGLSHTVKGTIASKQHRPDGWFKRFFTRDKIKHTEVSRLLTVTATADGKSLVTITTLNGAPANDDFSRQVLDAVAIRLGGGKSQ